MNFGMAAMKQTSRRKTASPAPTLVLLVLAVCAMLAALWYWSESALPVNGEDVEGGTPASASRPASSAAPATPAPPPAPPPLPETLLTDEAAAQLDAFLDGQPGSVSVWLRDLVTGDTYTYGESAGFYCASTLKAPYALWLCQKDETGEIDLDSSWNGSTGWDRIYKMITVSSNDAAHGLAGMWPATADTGFQDFLAQLGFASPEGCEITAEEGIHGWVTAQDGGLSMQALYDYFETGTEDAEQLKQAFLDAQHDYLWFPAPAAKKYGSWDSAFHDMGICYSQRPYILSVFTSYGTQDEPPAEGIEMMQQFGHLVADVMGQGE